MKPDEKTGYEDSAFAQFSKSSPEPKKPITKVKVSR
jgi:hypothetical protein